MTILTENDRKQLQDVRNELRRLGEPGSFLSHVGGIFDLLLKVIDSKQPTLTAAEKVHQGCFAESHVEEIADTLWPDLVGRVGADHYDNSLELFFTEDAPDTTVCTEAQAVEIFKLGFSRFWLNFCDGTEHAVVLMEGKILLGERCKAHIPRGGVRQSMLRSKLYAQIDQLEKKLAKQEEVGETAIHKHKLGLLEQYLEHGPMTKSDFLQLMQKDS